MLIPLHSTWQIHWWETNPLPLSTKKTVYYNYGRLNTLLLNLRPVSFFQQNCIWHHALPIHNLYSSQKNRHECYISDNFQNIAYSVVKNGSAACGGINWFKNVQDQLKNNAIKDVLDQILELEEGGLITMIINDSTLSRLLQYLEFQGSRLFFEAHLDDRLLV